MPVQQVLIHEPHRRSFRQITRTPININTAGDNTIITPTKDYSLRILWLSFVCNAAVNIKLYEGTTDENYPGALQLAMTGTMNFLANGSLSWDFRGRDIQLPLANNKSFVMNLSAANQVSGLLLTYEVD